MRSNSESLLLMEQVCPRRHLQKKLPITFPKPTFLTRGQKKIGKRTTTARPLELWLANMLRKRAWTEPSRGSSYHVPLTMDPSLPLHQTAVNTVESESVYLSFEMHMDRSKATGTFRYRVSSVISYSIVLGPHQSDPFVLKLLNLLMQIRKIPIVYH